MLAVLICSVLADFPEPEIGPVCLSDEYCRNQSQSYVFCFQLNNTTTKNCVNDDLDIPENSPYNTCNLINEKAAEDSPPWNNSIASCATDYSDYGLPPAIMCKCGYLNCFDLFYTPTKLCYGSQTGENGSLVQTNEPYLTVVCDSCPTTTTTMTTTTITTTTITTTVTTTTTIAPTYKGCFKDESPDRAMKHEISTGGYNTSSCHAECSQLGYDYFGLQYYQPSEPGSQCFCGDSLYNKYGFDDGNPNCTSSSGVDRVGGTLTNAVFAISDEYGDVCAGDNATKCIDFVSKRPEFFHFEPDDVTGLCVEYYWGIPCEQLCKDMSDCYYTAPPNNSLTRFGKCVSEDTDKCSMNWQDAARNYERFTCPEGFSPCLDATARFNVEESFLLFSDSGKLLHNISVNASGGTHTKKVWLDYSNGQTVALPSENIAIDAGKDLNRSSGVRLVLSYAGGVQQSVDLVTCNRRYVDSCNKMYCKEINLMVRVDGGVEPRDVCVGDSEPDADAYSRIFTPNGECRKGDEEKTIYLGENITGTVCLNDNDAAVSIEVSKRELHEGLYIFAGVGILAVVGVYAVACVRSNEAKGK